MLRSSLLASAVLLAAPHVAEASPYTSLTVFGDSYSDVGNLLIASTQLQATTGQPPQPAASNGYFAGRFSNGPIYVDVLSIGLTLKPTLPSLPGGGDFAFGGAATSVNTDEVPPYGVGFYPHDAYPWSLNAETAAFSARAAAAGGADPNGLYVVFSGLNDVAGILEEDLDPATTIASTVGGIINAVDAVKAAGGRTVLVPNLPDEGKLPVVTETDATQPGASANATALTVAYNTALAAALDKVTGIRVIRFDTFRLLDNVVADPSRYGFVDATDPCYTGTVTPDPGATTCAQPYRYVFWDVEHPTTTFHALLGAELLETVLTGKQPTD